MRFPTMWDFDKCRLRPSAYPERGAGKSQVIWVSIGNKQLDPPGQCWTPSGTLNYDSFLRNQPFNFSKIS